MKIAFVKNGVVTGITHTVVTEASASSSEAGVIGHTISDISPVTLGWLCTETATGPVFSEPPVVVVAPKVSPVEFKLLFTSAERVAIKAARATDTVIDDWFSIVDDPRLTYVDLGLQSTKDAIAYLVTKALITQARADQILAGVMV